MAPASKQVFVAFVLALVASSSGAEEIVAAGYSDPVERYGHFALGRPHEYARVTATTDAGRRLSLALPGHEVFEDLEPRLVRLTAEGPAELLAIVSARATGSRLVLMRLAGDTLAVSARSAPIGTPMRWMNPVGVADLDGDGRAEIAAVTTPHIGGVLRIYRRNHDALEEVASLFGFSNHVYGSPELGLSAAVAVGDQMRLVVPDTTRSSLRIIALERGRLVETRRCAVTAPVAGPLHGLSNGDLSVALTSGAERVRVAECPASPGA